MKVGGCQGWRNAWPRPAPIIIFSKHPSSRAFPVILSTKCQEKAGNFPMLCHLFTDFLSLAIVVTIQHTTHALLASDC